jgi:inorganic pyrophosphatase
MDINQIARSFLGREVTIHVDRPMGSRHPEHSFVYPVNYGYVPGVRAPDGDDLDAYVLGVDEPRSQFTGLCVAVIHRLDDDDDKLIVIPRGTDVTDKEIRAGTHFVERHFRSELLRE